MTTPAKKSHKPARSRLSRPRAATFTQDQIAQIGEMIQRIEVLEKQVKELKCMSKQYPILPKPAESFSPFPWRDDSKSVPGWPAPENPIEPWPKTSPQIICGDSPIYLTEMAKKWAGTANE